MTELQQKLSGIHHRLIIGDAHEQNNACNEALALLASRKKPEEREILCSMIVATLLDLNRETDWRRCIGILQNSSDFHTQLVAIRSEAWWCMKHKDLSGMLERYEKGLKMATRYDDKQAMAECYLEKGKTLIRMTENTAAIDSLGMAIENAKEVFNYKLIAVATYYIALAMNQLGQPAIALEKLREASDMAVAQKSQNIVRQTEVVRAKMLFEQGETEEAKTILNDWMAQFGLML